MDARVRPFKSRPVAALLILLAMMFGGAIDAAACEPEFSETTASAVYQADDEQDKTSKPIEQHGACVHGHCHHGSQSIAVFTEMPASHPTLLVLLWRTDILLKPYPGDPLRRPPRA